MILVTEPVASTLANTDLRCLGHEIRIPTAKRLISVGLVGRVLLRARGLGAVDAGELLSTLYLHTRVQNIVATVGKHPFATSASKKYVYQSQINLFLLEMVENR